MRSENEDVGYELGQGGGNSQTERSNGHRTRGKLFLPLIQIGSFLLFVVQQANLLGEGIIFVIGAGILTAEYIRSSVKESGKEKMRLAALQELSDRIQDLELESSQRDAQLRELNRICMALQRHTCNPVQSNPVQSSPTPPNTMETSTIIDAATGCIAAAVAAPAPQETQIVLQICQ